MPLQFFTIESLDKPAPVTYTLVMVVVPTVLLRFKMHTSLKTHMVRMLNAGILYERKQAQVAEQLDGNKLIANEHLKRESRLEAARTRITARKFSDD